MKKARCMNGLSERAAGLCHAAFNHIAVSKALLISGMFMPKLAFDADFAGAFTGFSAFSTFSGFSVTLGATSVARSHDPCSWERATEKNRST